MQEVSIGSVEGTGAAINVSLGFKPDYVRAVNYTDTAGDVAAVEWFSGMTAAHGLKTLGIADDGTSSDESAAFITSLGISQYDGTDALTEGFTIGADTDVNVDGDTIVYIAIRN